MELGSKFSQVLVGTNYESLPEEAIIASKQAILDTLGVMLAATGVGEDADKVVTTLDVLGGDGSCTVICNDKRSNPVFAAMANGAFAHSIDFDNVHDDAFVHPSASVVPVALTMGEYVKASGKDLIAAVALGDDLICRLGFAVSNPPENSDLLWMLPVSVGTFSATAAASKLLGLNAQQALNAFGIAFNRATGSKQLVIESGSLRGLYSLFPATTGALSSLLAKNGVPGFEEPFNGTAGFFNVFYHGVYDDSAFDEMGSRFDGAGVSIKPWPCCRFTNTHVNAALNITRENDIDPAKVLKIVLYYCDDEAKRCLFPEDERKNPPSIPGAKLSMPFAVASALAYRNIEIRSFSAEKIKDPLILGLTAKTSYEYDETLHSNLSKTMLPGKVRVEMEDGAIYEERVDVVYGHPKNRMRWEDLVVKFRDCASFARREFSVEEIDAIACAIEHLEEIDDVTEVMKLVQ